MSFLAAFVGAAVAALALRLLDVAISRHHERLEDAITQELAAELLETEAVMAAKGNPDNRMEPCAPVPRRFDGLAAVIAVTALCPCGVLSVRQYAARRQAIAPMCPMCGRQSAPVELEVE